MIVAACLLDADSGGELRAERADLVMRTASVGKVLLLIECARRFIGGELDEGRPLARTAEDAVADSGLWQHLRAAELPAGDLAVLVGAASDNLAANVLLRTVGLEAVALLQTRLGLAATGLHDRVRDVRGPDDPATLSTGTASELAGLMGRLHRDDIPGVAGAGPMVLSWLALDADTSMAACALGLDPLAHVGADRGLRLAHKTGTDSGVRADVGVVAGPARTVAYAVLAEFDDEDRDAVLDAMREWGRAVRALVAS